MAIYCIFKNISLPKTLLETLTFSLFPLNNTFLCCVLLFSLWWDTKEHCILLYACTRCMYVHAHTCGSHRGTSSIFHTTIYAVLRKGLSVNWKLTSSVRLSGIYLPKNPWEALRWVLGLKFRYSCLHSKCSYQLNYLNTLYLF